MSRDPAASAPLSELVAVNIAGDIDHIVGTLEGASEVLLGPHGPTVQARQIGELCEELATRLRRIAAGIRGTLGEVVEAERSGGVAPVPRSPCRPDHQRGERMSERRKDEYDRPIYADDRKKLLGRVERIEHHLDSLDGGWWQTEQSLPDRRLIPLPGGRIAVTAQDLKVGDVVDGSPVIADDEGEPRHRGKYVWDLWYEGTLVLLDKAAES